MGPEPRNVIIKKGTRNCDVAPGLRVVTSSREELLPERIVERGKAGGTCGQKARKWPKDAESWEP